MLKMSLLPFSGLAWSWNSWPRKSSSLSLCRWIMVPIPPSSTMILSRRMASISSCRLFFTPALKKVKSGLSERGEKRCDKVSKNYWKATKLCWLESLKIPNVEPPPWFSFSWPPSTQPTSAVPSLLPLSSKSLSLRRKVYLTPSKVFYRELQNSPHPLPHNPFTAWLTLLSFSLLSGKSTSAPTAGKCSMPLFLLPFS